MRSFYIDMNKVPTLAIVVPCYNEEAVFTNTERQLRELLMEMGQSGLVSEESKVIYVDDGSSDDTWNLIAEAYRRNPNTVAGIKLGHNVGHQNALIAGLETVEDHCDCAITIDADLQDDINVIPEMVRKYIEGNEVVFGVRESRQTDTWFKRTSAHSFYKLMSRLGVETVYNHADFRLMSSRAIRELLRYKERNLYLRGIIKRVGLKNTIVKYDRKAREAGESKYPLTKMISFAVEGITSFSVKPVKMVFYLGIIFIIIAFFIFIYTMYRYLHHDVIEGWTSLMLSIWFCTGVILSALGIVGEYVGKIFIEVKERPRFVIETQLGI